MTYPPPTGPMYPMSGGPNPFDPSGAMAAKRSRRRMTIILSAIVAVLVLIVGAGAVKLYSDKTGKDLFPSLTLRSADDPGPDPFTSSVALSHGAVQLQNRVPAATQQGIRLVNGTEPGLYASTGTASCDTARLGNELSADPAAGRAWARVFGISVNDIPWYLNTLTPVVLTADTWVTNHAYRSGTPSAFQSVLQAGTPLYVDAAGVPRVVCACGNPLLPPAAAPVGGYRVTGTAWHDYHSTEITRITTNNQYVTNVNNTTTVVNNPAPPQLQPLQVQNVITGVLDMITVGGTLNLPPTPADVKLPDPTAANSSPSFQNADEAARQGLVAGSTQALPAMAEQAAANNNVPQVETDKSSTQSSAPATDASGTPAPTSGAAPSVSAPPAQSTVETGSPSTTTTSPNSTATSTATTTGSTTASSTTTATPTSFSGSGSTISALTFAASDGTSVTCSRDASATADSSTVTLTCTGGSTYTFAASAISKEGVGSATDSSGVWKARTTSGETLTVKSATF